jgi:type III secretion protein V
LAVIFALVAFFGAKREKAIKEGREPGSTGAKTADGKTAKGPGGVSPIIPILVEIAANLKGSSELRQVDQEAETAKGLVSTDLGVPFPSVVVRFSEAMPENTYTIRINEVPVTHGKLRPGHSIVRESAENMSVIGIEWEEDERFLPDTVTRWVRNSSVEMAKTAGFTTLSHAHIVGRHLVYVLTKHASEFVGIQESKILMSALEATHPDLVKEAQRVMSMPKMTEIMQRLVSESISIRDIRTVTEALIEWGQREKESVLLTEYIRIALKRYISYRYANAEGMIPAYMFSPAVEEMVRDAIRQTATGSYLALDPEVSKKLTANILKATGDVNVMSTRPVLLTAMDVRRYIRKMIESEAFYLSVLSFQELIPEVNVHPLGRIDL